MTSNFYALPNDQVKANRRKNLLELVRQAGTVAKFNSQIGRDPRDPYLYQLVSGLKTAAGTTRAPGVNICNQIEKALKLPAGWLSLDHSAETNENKNPQIAEPDPMPTTAPQGFVKVPRLTLFGGIELYGDQIFLDRLGFEHRFPDRNPADFRGLVVSGDSMRPAFCDGDRLLIDTARATACPGVYVIEIEGRYLLRRLKADISGAVQITADGLPGEAMPLDPDRVKIIGRAAFVWRGEML